MSYLIPYVYRFMVACMIAAGFSYAADLLSTPAALLYDLITVAGFVSASLAYALSVPDRLCEALILWLAHPKEFS